MEYSHVNGYKSMTLWARRATNFAGGDRSTLPSALLNSVRAGAPYGDGRVPVRARPIYLSFANATGEPLTGGANDHTVILFCGGGASSQPLEVAVQQSDAWGASPPIK